MPQHAQTLTPPMAGPRNTTTNTAVIYIRTASAAPRDRGDIARQRTTCRIHARMLTATVACEFTDCGVSGTTLDRPGLRAMLQYLAEHRVDYVIANDRLRISRRLEQHDTVIAALRDRGATLTTIADDDPASAGELDVRALIAAGDHLHRDHHGVSLPLRKSKKFTAGHTRSTITRLATATKHSDSPDKVNERTDRTRREASR